MPKGPRGEKRPADAIGLAVKIARIATGEDTDDTPDDGKDKAVPASAETTPPAPSKKHISQEGLEEQGWKAQVPADKIDIDAPADHVVMHIIAHTHCDPGWLQTFEDYYRSSVKQILGTWPLSPVLLAPIGV